MIDHVIGTYALPISMVRGMVVNGKEYLVPMVCEELWMVSCAERGAELAAQCGGFRATYTGSIMISQIQLTQLANPHTACLRIMEHKQEILELANQVDSVLASLGGGAFAVEAKSLCTEVGSMVIAATGLAENLWTPRTLATGGLQAEFVPSLERRRET